MLDYIGIALILLGVLILASSLTYLAWSTLGIIGALIVLSLFIMIIGIAIVATN